MNFFWGIIAEIEAWIREGRVDCGFLCLPVRPDLDTIFLERDDFLATLPTAHPLAQAERIFLDALCKEPFLILEKDKNAEITDFSAEKVFRPMSVLLLGMITPFSPLRKAVLGSAFCLV